VVEYLGGLYLFQVAAHLGHRPATVCFVAGMTMIVLAALTGRPLGVGPLPRHLHRLVDLGLVAGVAAAPFVFHFVGDLAAVFVLEALAAAMIVVVKLTNYAHPQPKVRAQPPSSAPALSRRKFSEEILIASARKAGRTARMLKENGPRSAGKVVGRLLPSKRRPADGS
jgi:hypothetical protein